ncbi:winged helix-turn-helix transcriptional regulator [Curvivirga aplysinae]|uniref:winged helix-turn-helix transcriptional regulator n=1 Tax=Curvivirga aplysinae TaxID=2529852 RepID=UPI0012BC78FF|nr:helix-turn-helix domain-containing protein [Curvivirga aplysinae]MTI08422.1 transcriptional regulator [Curvivirga aplysinae]
MDVDIPKIGQAVRGSSSGKPIMVLFDLLGRSWALGIIWSLSDGPLTFRALQDKCGDISPSVLNRRIKELRASRVLDHEKSGYYLTDTGRELFSLLSPLGHWAIKWGEELQKET